MDTTHIAKSVPKKQFWLVEFVKTHKMISIAVIAALGWIGFFAYEKLGAKDAGVSYRTAPVEKGMIISSVSGTGQVSMSGQVDIKPKVSGDITYIGVRAGQEVKAGTLLFAVDPSDALKSVRDAQTDLETEQLELDELLAPVDVLTLLQARNSLENARENFEKLKRTHSTEYQNAIDAKQDAEDDLQDAYEGAFSDVSDAFLDLPDVITDLYNILYENDIAESEPLLVNSWSNILALWSSIDSKDTVEQRKFDSFSDISESSYALARKAYEDNFDNYKDTSRYSDNDDIASLLSETIETSKKISEAIKNTINMFDYWTDYRSQNSKTVYSAVTARQSTLSSLTGIVNSHISSLLSSQNSVRNGKDAIAKAEKDIEDIKIGHPLEIASSERNLKELEEKLKDLESDPDELDIRSKRIAMQKARDNLASSQQDLADHYVRAPFDGLIALVGAAKGDSVSSGTVLTTIVTKQHIAEVALNEIDAVNIKVGQKATLGFDAIEDLSITGEVVEMDTLGTVTQGVVSFNIKIAFDIQDERVRSGMSVSASIISQSKQDVLMAPISAIKTQGAGDYAETLVDNQPQRVVVETGISNDTMIEIVSGLQEGDLVITQTTANGVSASSSSGSAQNRNFSPPVGGEVFRMMR